MSIHAVVTWRDGDYTRGELATEGASLAEASAELARMLAADSCWLTFSHLDDVPDVVVNLLSTPRQVRSIHLWEQDEVTP